MAELPSGTVTFLFTDVEDSTRLWQDHTDAMQRALARHDAIVRDAIERHVGFVVKMRGDGFHAAFATASDAIAAATSAQLAIAAEDWAIPEPLRVRIGIHSGPAELRDGDYYGTVVNRAARIVSTAHGGQTVLSRATTELVRDASFELLDLGEHYLRGLARPEHLFELVVPGLRAHFPPLVSEERASGPQLSLPAFASDHETYTGRATALAQFDARWQQARQGTHHVVLVAGEPGIGKTRFAAEASRRAFAAGAAVLYGRCDEETVVPFQPFIEALRPYVAQARPAELRQQLHGLTGDLARIFPALDGFLPEREPASGEPAATGGLDDRYRLFEGFTALLAGISASQPLLIVLDDLQWADQPTILLLRHVLRGTSQCPLLVLGCYRDVDLPRDDPLRDLAADLGRERSATRIALDGLSEAESEEFVQDRAGREIAPELVHALHRETDGNPFFLEEMLRHLQETDATTTLDIADVVDLNLPDPIRNLVVRRVRRLPDPAGSALGAAAVVGPEFETSLVAQLIGRPAGDVLDAIDRAEAAGLVVVDPDVPGRCAFAHALVRHALYTEVGIARRTQLHHDIGMLMELAGADRYSPATLARHFGRAVALGDAARAVKYATAAGRESARDLAFEDAVRHFEEALRFLDLEPFGEPSLRAQVLVDRAEALVFVDEAAGVDAALEGVDASRRGSPLQFARAVAVFVEPALTASMYPREAAELFDEAMTTLGPDAPELRARLLAIVAFKYTTSQLTGRDGRALAEEALAAARITGDPRTLAEALFARAVSLEGDPDLAERFALADELVELGRTAGARPWSYGLGVLAGAQLGAGDADSLSSTIREHQRVGEELHWLPAQVHATRWSATQALMEGRFDAARTAAQNMRRYVAAYRGAAGIRGMILFHVAREQGELAHDVANMALEDQRQNLHGLVMLALAQLACGEVVGAIGELAVAAADGPAWAGDPAWPAYLAVLTEAAALADDPTHADFLTTHLAPFEGLLLSVPTGLATLGAADRYLGMLAALRGRWDDAAARFHAAQKMEYRARGWALVPRTRYWYARFLRRRGRVGDTAGALAALRIAVEETERLGMQRLHAESAALLSD